MTLYTIIALWLLAILSSEQADAQRLEPRTPNCWNIATRICSIDPNYNPIPNSTAGPNDPAYSRPSCQNPDQATAAEKTSIISAISAAKGQVNKELCALTNIFIMKNSTTGGALPPSWGFWENPVYHTIASGNTYIALRASDVNHTLSAKQDETRQALGITLGNHIESNIPWGLAPQTFGLLYVLAHELGHIKWHQPISIPCQSALLKSWTDITTGQQRWTGFNVGFGDRDYSSIAVPKGSPLSKSEIDSIYQGGFATALGSVSPEEDFVEAYALRAVMKACPTCKFQYQITASDVVDLHNDRGSSILGGKFGCADAALPLFR
jgi:hypothetical protein